VFEHLQAHYGMMLAARNVLQKINSIRVLDQAVADYPTYTVVLTGIISAVIPSQTQICNMYLRIAILPQVIVWVLERQLF